MLTSWRRKSGASAAGTPADNASHTASHSIVSDQVQINSQARQLRQLLEAGPQLLSPQHITLPRWHGVCELVLYVNGDKRGGQLVEQYACGLEARAVDLEVLQT